MKLITKTKQKVTSIAVSEGKVVTEYLRAVEAVKAIEGSANYLAAKQALKDAEEAVREFEPEEALEKRVLQGEGHTLSIGAKGKVRTITNQERLAELLGNEVFSKVAKVPLSAVDDYLTPEQRDMVLDIAFTGKRKITVK